jgi:hypothetical protein
MPYALNSGPVRPSRDRILDLVGHPDRKLSKAPAGIDALFQIVEH